MVPLLEVTALSPEVMFEHRVKDLVGYEEHKLAIGLLVHKVRVKPNPLAVSRRSRYVIGYCHGHLESDAADERML
jgi:hypothetical protein